MKQRQVGTLREQLDIIHGRTPPEALPEAFSERLAATFMANPHVWGPLLLHLVRVGQEMEEEDKERMQR